MRAALDRQAQALWAPVSQALAPQAPQMAPPLHQPLPSSRGWLATPYQQAVQPLSKSTGLGDRGQDDNTRPASHSRGM